LSAVARRFPLPLPERVDGSAPPKPSLLGPGVFLPIFTGAFLLRFGLRLSII
jgi:hypothetical protein